MLQIFNYRLSRGRRLIENAFGILSSTWRILLRRIDLEPHKVSCLVLACCALHNLIQRNRPAPQGGAPAQLEPQQPAEQVEMPGLDAVRLRPAEDARLVRQSFCDYVNTVGAVPWQNNMVNLD